MTGMRTISVLLRCSVMLFSGVVVTSRLLAALSSEGVVSLFDPVHRKLLRTLVGGEAAFNLAFSRSGKRLAIASGDFAFVWDATTGRQLLKATHAASQFRNHNKNI